MTFANLNILIKKMLSYNHFIEHVKLFFTNFFIQNMLCNVFVEMLLSEHVMWVMNEIYRKNYIYIYRERERWT
jgi:hypothetical protein